ncbi:hypothetical protein OTU49_004808 [Cherax quadricarinatus]|uniref:C-type lectin domain-containing protein n=3 Tax=Cherax quadricarinatus TaxID=27406 RepID=A0AAW0XBS8_CHEQU
MWNDVECKTLNGYVCQRPVDAGILTHTALPVCDINADDVSYDGACYKVVSDAVTWEEAEKTCVSHGGHLASVHHRSEDAMMWVLMQETNLTEAWLGFSYMQDGHVFRWTDGYPSFYSHWGDGEPNVSLSEHKCTRVSTLDGLWSTHNCSDTSPFICKYNKGQLPTPDPPVTGHCPDNRWLDLGGRYCYFVSVEQKPWADANWNCLQEHSNLVSVHSEGEVQLLLMAMHHVRNSVWLGLVQKKDGFGWSDHTAVDFLNWNTGEPNGEDEHCTEMFTSTGGWNDASCSLAKNFICKTLKDAASSSTVSLTSVSHNNNLTTPFQDVSTVLPLTADSNTNRLSSKWSSSPLTGGSIFGITLAVVLVAAIFGYTAYTYLKKKPKLAGYGSTLHFQNALYSTRENISITEPLGAEATIDIEDGSVRTHE